MKNILIPTTLQKDTIQAVKIAMAEATGKQITIVLMLLKQSPDVSSAAYWLRKLQDDLDAQQEAVLETCHEMVSKNQGVRIRLQRQFSMTKPLLRNFTEAFEIGLSIIPDTFLRSPESAHRHFVQLLQKSDTPILQLTPEWEEAQFSKALYLESSQSPLQAKDLVPLVAGHFSFRIVSQAQFFDEANHEEMTPVLYETISKNGIDLLIETRKPKKIFKKNTVNRGETYGLPVLSVCEPAY